MQSNSEGGSAQTLDPILHSPAGDSKTEVMRVRVDALG